MNRHVCHRTIRTAVAALTLLIPAFVVCTVPSSGADASDRPVVKDAPGARPGPVQPPTTRRSSPAPTLSSPATLGAPSTPALAGPASTSPALGLTQARGGILANHPAAGSVTPPSGPSRIPVNQLKLMNYTPAQAPWLAMWQRYNHAQINSDFAAIKGLGANAVRIAIDPAGVGWPTLTTTGANELIDIVNLAKANGLAVQFTLFDWWNPFNSVADSITWMRSALSRFAGDPSIALVEVKNEIDVTNPTMLSWTRAMLAALPAILPGVPRTVSVAGAQDLGAMRTLNNAIPQSYLDVIDTHLYGITAVVGAKLAAAQAIANGRPIFVGEMGKPTAATASTCPDYDQAAFYTWMQTMLAKANVTGFAPWTYTDFDPAYLPSQYVGTAEANFGLRRLNGTWKPAATVIKNMFASGGGQNSLLSLAAQAQPYQYFDGDFECTASRTPSSTTISANDGWTTFDASQVQVAGTSQRQGVGGSTAGFLGNTRGDAHGNIPSLMHGFSLVSGGTVSVTADVRLVKPTGYTTIALSWFAGNRYLGGVQATPVSNNTANWQTVTVSGTPPVGADSFQVHLKSYANTGTAFFDDVSILNRGTLASAARPNLVQAAMLRKTAALPL